MKCKVRLTQTVEMFVEGESEEAIMDWLYSTTPDEAADLAINMIDIHYDEEIVCKVSEDSEVDYVIDE